MEIQDRRSGWARIEHAVLDEHGRALGPAGLAVYLALARHADRAGSAFPSLRRLAMLVGVSTRTVQRVLPILEARGLIVIEKRISSLGDADSNLYALVDLRRGAGGVVLVSPPCGPGVTTGCGARTTEVELEEEVEPRNEKKTPAPAAREDGFEEFWTSYPKKRGKGDALKAWRSLRPDAALVRRILDAVRVQKQSSEDWRRDGGQFIPYPATWLRAHQWLDEVVSNGVVALAAPAYERNPVIDAVNAKWRSHAPE